MEIKALCEAAIHNYEEGNYAEAVPHMERAIAMGQAWLLLPCADIYRRALDGRVRAPEAAASLYLQACDSGDGDAISYLASLSAFLIDQEGDFQERVSLLVYLWEATPALELSCLDNGHVSKSLAHPMKYTSF
jgi:hypothetical protein